MDENYCIQLSVNLHDINLIEDYTIPKGFCQNHRLKIVPEAVYFAGG
jgi:hypothetical protein